MSDVPAAPAGQEEGASSNIFQGSATVASVEKEEGLISEVQNWTGGEQDSFSSGGVSGHLLVLVFLVVLDVVTVVRSSFFLHALRWSHTCMHISVCISGYSLETEIHHTPERNTDTNY